jgi:hypothetical protein
MTTTTPATPDATPEPAPLAPLTPPEELAKLRLILGHTARLSPESRRWLRDRLDTELAQDGQS